MNFEAEAPVTKTGDLWRLGNHRLICGDATDQNTVKLLLDGAVPHLMVTDQPYGVNYDPGWREKIADRSQRRNTAIGKVENDDVADWRAAWALFPGDVAYVWHSSLQGNRVQASLEASRFVMRAQIIWDKGRPNISRGNYHWQHEACLYMVRRNKTGHWNGGYRQSTVWPITHRRSRTGHSTEKPLQAMQRPIENNSRPGDAVYDPFLGSGTTLIAAELLDRVCYAVEINPLYVDAAVRRWEILTGRRASRVPHHPAPQAMDVS